MEDENKIKTFIKNNFLYFVIALASLAYIAYGFLSIEESGKSIVEIIGQGGVVFLVAYLICRLFSMQGLLAGDRKKEVIKTNQLHSKCVADIDPKINELDVWCEQENAKALERVRKQILNKEGLRYSDCFDNEGTPKDIDFPLEELVIKGKDGSEIDPSIAKKEKPELYKVAYAKNKAHNARQIAKRRAFHSAIRVKITPLSADAITATTVKVNDPHNFGMDRKKYQKVDARSDLLSKAILGIIFSYFSFSFIAGWENLISAVLQVAIFLLFGGIKWFQSYYFVVEDLRKRTVRQINYIQKFKCDKGIITSKETEEELKSIGGNINGTHNKLSTIMERQN